MADEFIPKWIAWVAVTVNVRCGNAGWAEPGRVRQIRIVVKKNNFKANIRASVAIIAFVLFSASG